VGNPAEETYCYPNYLNIKNPEAFVNSLSVHPFSPENFGRKTLNPTCFRRVSLLYVRWTYQQQRGTKCARNWKNYEPA
jgi:hypothetical protein